MSLDFLVFTSWVMDLKKSRRVTLSFYLSFMASSCFCFLPLLLWYYPYFCICSKMDVWLWVYPAAGSLIGADDTFFKNMELLISSLPFTSSGILTSSTISSAYSNSFWLINFIIDYLALRDCIFWKSSVSSSDSMPRTFFSFSVLLRNKLIILDGPWNTLGFISNSMFFGIGSLCSSAA